MADRATLNAEPRVVLGKKVKLLRQQGILPANVYGNGIESKSIQLVERDFTRTVKSVGIRTMFELAIEGEEKPRYVILRGLSRQGGTGKPSHIDFYQVDLRRPIQTTVRINAIHDAPAVKDLAGTLIQPIDSVLVRCLPLDLPESLEVDLSILTSFDISIAVGDLVAPENVEILTDPSVLIATVNPPRIRLDAEDEEEGAEEGEEGAEGEPGEGGERADSEESE